VDGLRLRFFLGSIFVDYPLNDARVLALDRSLPALHGDAVGLDILRPDVKINLGGVPQDLLLKREVTQDILRVQNVEALLLHDLQLDLALLEGVSGIEHRLIVLLANERVGELLAHLRLIFVFFVVQEGIILRDLGVETAVLSTPLHKDIVKHLAP